MKNRAMRNKIMVNLSDTDFAAIVASMNSFSSICRAIGLRVQGSNYTTLKRRIARQNLSTSHFIDGRRGGFGRGIPLEEKLVENSTYHETNALKKTLFSVGVLKNECAKCGNVGIWVGEPLVLQLDHENGVRNDNRIENLRIMCPNCHSQTMTHSGKRFKKHFECPQCGGPYSGGGSMCMECRKPLNAKHLNRRNINWPNNAALSGLVWKFTLEALAVELNCSTTGLRKRCANHNIKYPPQGYWQRIAAGKSHDEALQPPPPRGDATRKFTEIEQRCLRELLANGYKCRELARMVGVSHSTISRFKSGASYKSATAQSPDAPI